ncbi:MAG: hypothetical protein A4E53_04586 [Pelotomaculum sp. PtaB.Bin104]|nr:MAG: hypothetical protein A4E53_04586 [Pelotomaculum sp. PtaB.Bin104]
MFDELVEESGGEMTRDEALVMGELTGERLNELFLTALRVPPPARQPGGPLFHHERKIRSLLRGLYFLRPVGALPH